jgi:cytochrome bd ubiquinol oxidase subunit II
MNGPLLATAIITLLAIACYAIFGGADFGGGVWDLLATGPRKGLQRSTVSHAIGPVWEANHVWLIFIIVIMFTCFPPVYADVATGLNTPFSLALIGIVLRGAAFVFRNYATDSPSLAQTWTVVFGATSIIAPFFLGDAIGAVATGTYAWTSPFALAVGLFSVALCAQAAAVFLLRETNIPQLQADFRRRAIGSTVAVWVLGLVPMLLAKTAQPSFFTALTGPSARIAIVVAMLLGVVTMVLVARGQDILARLAVGAEFLAVLIGWFGAQAPNLVPGHWTLASAASPPATLATFLVIVAVGMALLVPSMILMFMIFKGPERAA